MIIFGGVASPFAFTNTIFFVNMSTGYIWRVETNEDSAVPSGRAGHSVVYYKNEMYVFGGESQIYEEFYVLNDVSECTLFIKLTTAVVEVQPTDQHLDAVDNN
jgi:hypothetical protein